MLRGFWLPLSVFSHGGRTNSSDCHNCNTGKCTYTYHYHYDGDKTVEHQDPQQEEDVVEKEQVLEIIEDKDKLEVVEEQVLPKTKTVTITPEVKPKNKKQEIVKIDIKEEEAIDDIEVKDVLVEKKKAEKVKKIKDEPVNGDEEDNGNGIVGTLGMIGVGYGVYYLGKKRRGRKMWK